MLTTNVLCMKKRKKRRYSVSNVSDYKSKPTTDKRSSSAVTMMHITEDTPPDMLAGAMDLTVHLPNGRAVKMSVERSTPMMDLLVQIVTVHHLQLSGHIIQALEMAPSAGISDKILPYKPNTPIGALDTQHIKVVPKNRNMPVSRSAALPGHQPFESTFRLKVHLPRNQLYVTRVSQNVYLEDIMSKVCKEKDLDALKYEFRHPGNLDEVLDPKLTLSDYQITEIYVVSRGSGRLTQAFSTSDIMALRKEEERKQFQAKTGGGVFNLIFKRGKPNPAMTTTGSVSSDTRSISPTHSDDSRSVTPPAFQPPIIKEPPPPEKPKPPQRKRRPAPKPPQMVEERRSSDEKPTSQISERSQNSDSKKVENGLTICHSRNSSDSSGYHEASVLSENCNNTSLPRRPKTITTTEDVTDSANLSGEHSKSTGNLIKMTSESKSTSSLAFTSRKKKAAPPPPQPVLKTEISKAENASPTVVASQNVEMRKVSTAIARSCSDNIPIPVPRRFKHTASQGFRTKSMSDLQSSPQLSTEIIVNEVLFDILSKDVNSDINEAMNDEATRIFDDTEDLQQTEMQTNRSAEKIELVISEEANVQRLNSNNKSTEYTRGEVGASYDSFSPSPMVTKDDDSYLSSDSYSQQKSFGSMDSLRSDLSLGSVNSKGSKPEIVGVIPKKRKLPGFDTLSRKRGFQIGTSLIGFESEDGETISFTSGTSELADYPSMSSKMSDAESGHVNDYEINDFNEEFFKKSVSKKTGKKYREKRVNELLEIHNLDIDVDNNKGSIVKNQSASSLRSVDSLPGFMGIGNMKKWHNTQELDDISMISSNSLMGRSRWVIGDISDTESTSTFPTNQTPPESLPSTQSQSSSSSVRTSVSLQQTPKPVNTPDISNETQSVELKIESTHSIEETHTDKVSLSTCDNKNEVDSGICENISTENLEKNDLDLESDWQYQLPSPPRGFRDASPVATAIPSNFDTETVPDSVVTSPELFEKLKQVKNTQEIDNDSVLSEEDKEICNKLTLEHLEKRKSLVYNRELATSLKCVPQTYNLMASRKSTVLNELENVISNQQTTTLLKNPIKTNTHKSTTYDKNLPNFKITTYDVKKDKINIFEDDTVRSNADFRRSSLNIENNVSDKSDAENVSLLTNGNHKQEKDTLTTHAISNESIFCPKRDLNENGKEDKVAVQKTTSEVTYAKKSEDNFTMGKEGYSESFSIRKNSADDIFKKPHELSKYRLKNSFFEKNKNVNTFNTNYGIGRSESFSNNEAWTPSNPVKRSKSQVALNKYKDENLVKSIGGSTENLSKSGVLFDVSGLQSLEVIRLIQTKLSNSSEQLDSLAHAENPKKEETKSPIVNSTPVTKIYQNRGPPSINVSSWSQRPKTQVTLKEDTDYKHNSINTRNGFVNDLSGNTAARTQSHSRVKINGVDCETKNENNVSIKVNGSETISQQKSGNVVIKIGSMDDKIKNDRFINHITPDGYRKPLGNINKIERSSRPHSIAFDSQFDISRVPIVRSVELKKPFKDLHTNKSVTQIYSESNDLKRQDDAPKSLNYDTNLKNSHVYLSNESINKSVFRNGSITPVVKGFRTENGNITNANRKTWNLYGTLPAKTNNQTDLTTNKNVPFSQSNLRRTESNKTIPNVVDKGSIFGNVVLRNNSNSFKNTESILPSPPPPVNLDLLHHDNVIFPKKSKMSECNGEPREELLSAIRNFGGKNGLRTAKR